jgi:hypothetical protein
MTGRQLNKLGQRVIKNILLSEEKHIPTPLINEFGFSVV